MTGRWALAFSEIGECFMYLCWVESIMRDFVTLKEGGKVMRQQYRTAVLSKQDHPSDFACKRLELSDMSFRVIKDKFLSEWSEWNNDHNIHESIERAVIYRNGIGHAHIQLNRNFLLYTPFTITPRDKGKNKVWEAIDEYIKCSECRDFYKNCVCVKNNLAKPRTLTFPLDNTFICQIYEDIKIIDLYCFTPTAKSLDVPHQNLGWPCEEIGTSDSRISDKLTYVNRNKEFGMKTKHPVWCTLCYGSVTLCQRCVDFYEKDCQQSCFVICSSCYKLKSDGSMEHYNRIQPEPCATLIADDLERAHWCESGESSTHFLSASHMCGLDSILRKLHPN